MRPSRWGAGYRIQGMGESDRIYHEEVNWWAPSAYRTHTEARAVFDRYRGAGFYGGVVEARTEAERATLDAKRAEFLRREPDILDRKYREDLWWAGRTVRMFASPWYSQWFWYLVYGHRGAWRVLGVVLVLAVAGSVLTVLL
jgi:hypothetical protein